MEADDRDRVITAALIFGAPSAAAAVTLSIAWLAGNFSFALDAGGGAIVWANTALAMIGSGTGAWRLIESPWDRLFGMVFCGLTGLVIHATVVVAGAVALGV